MSNAERIPKSEFRSPKCGRFGDWELGIRHSLVIRILSFVICGTATHSPTDRSSSLGCHGFGTPNPCVAAADSHASHGFGVPNPWHPLPHRPIKLAQSQMFPGDPLLTGATPKSTPSMSSPPREIMIGNGSVVVC